MKLSDGCNWMHVKTLGDLVVRMGILIIILLPLGIWKCFDILLWVLKQCR